MKNQSNKEKVVYKWESIICEIESEKEPILCFSKALSKEFLILISTVHSPKKILVLID